MIKSIFKSPSLFAYFLIAILGFAAYSNSLHNDFVMDDYHIIWGDTKIHNIKNIYYQFIPDLTRYLQIESSGRHAYYRPFAHILPMLNFLMFRENVFYYHLFNLILFCLCGISLYVLTMQLFKNERLALLTSILFIVHPINGLFVNYLTANVFGLQVLSMSWATTLFIRSFDHRRSICCVILSVFCFITACFCHETAFFLPFYLVLIQWVYKKSSWKHIFMRTLPYFVILTLFFVLRFKYASLQGNIFGKINLQEMTIFHYTATYAKLCFWYFSRFVYTKGIVMNWATPVLGNMIWQWNSALVLLLGAIIFAFFMPNKYPNRVFIFYWVILGLIPVIFGCVVNLNRGFFMIEPHWLFFASFGVFWAVASGLLFLQKFIGKLILTILLVSVILLLIFQSRQYNRLWGDEIRYCKTWQDEVPVIKDPFFYMASAYMRKGFHDQARINFLKTLEGIKADWEVYNNLGLIEYERKNYKVAVQYYEQALRYHPHSAVVYNNLGVVYNSMKQTNFARKNFQQALKMDRFKLEPRINLIDMDIKQKRWQEAEKNCRINLEINPQHNDSLRYLMIILLHQDKTNELSALGHRILKNRRLKGKFLTNIGSLLAQKMPDLALQFYVKAYQTDRDYIESYIELGKLLANHGKFQEAITVWQNGQKVFPDDYRFQANIQKAKQLSK